MFDKNRFYEDAADGIFDDFTSCIQYIKSFSRIIIWGAGNLGTAIGSKFDEMSIPYDYYWDTRYESISECNGKEVMKPFSKIEDKQNTLIVFCISNVFVSPKLLEQLVKEDINYIYGTSIYQALACPISADHFDVSQCYTRKECNVATCKRMSNIVYKISEREDKVFINTLDVYLTQKCSLSCKYCYIYNNSYPKDKRHNFNTERILDDIDIICDIASYIKRMVPFGGEPFLHPDIDIIIEKMAAKKNVGVIDIISNGIFHQPVEKLKKLKYDNVKINISNYNMALGDQLVQIRNNNIKTMQDLGLNIIVHNETPQWQKPGLLNDNQLSAKGLTNKKIKCSNFCNLSKEMKDTAETMIIKNGRFFPCQHCDTVFNLEIDSSPKDSIELSKEMDRKKLADEIKALLGKPYYQACKYCNQSIELVEIAGVQGVDERYLVP